MKPVTDPNILNKLNEVTDPDLLAQLNGTVRGKPTAPPSTRSIFGDIPAAIGSGTIDAIEQYSRAIRALDPKGGIDIAENLGTKGVEFAKSYQKSHPEMFAQPEGTVRKAVYGGVRSMIPSVTAGIPGAVVGSVVPGAGTIAGYALGGGTVFGLAEADRFYEEATSQGIPPDKAFIESVKAGAWEGGLEAANNALDLLLMKMGKPLTSPLKATLKDILKPSIGKTAKQFAKTTAKVIPAEVGTEMAQEYGGAARRQKLGMETAAPMTAAKEVIGPTIFSSLLFGLGGSGYNALQRHQITKNITDANSPINKRNESAEVIANELIRQGKEDLAANWMDHAGKKIDNKEAIDVGYDFGKDVPPAVQETAVQETEIPVPAEPYGPSDILPQELQVTPQQKLIKKPDTTVTDYMQDRGEITPIQLATHGLLSMTPTEMKADLKTRLSTAGIGPTGLGIVDDMDIARPSDIKPMLDAIDKALNGASKEVKTELNKTKIALKYWNSEQFGKLVNKNTNIISQIKDELISGNPGTRIRDYGVQGQGGTADVIGIPSTYPEYFRGKGLTASDVIGYIDIIQGGGKLAEGQQATIENLIRDKRAHVITEVKSVINKRRQARRQTEIVPAGLLDVGDTFNKEGEKHQVIGIDGNGNRIIKNGETIVAGLQDEIPIDKGWLKGVKNKPVPKGVILSAEEETSKIGEDADANAEERLLGKSPASGEDVLAAEFGLKTPAVIEPVTGKEPHAKGIREDEGQLQKGGIAGQGGKTEGGEDIQRKQEAGAKAGWEGREVKQPWEMTKSDYVKAHEDDIVPDAYSKHGQSRAEKRDIEYRHKLIIQSAISEGKTIPPEVLKDYPDLQPIHAHKEIRPEDKINSITREEAGHMIADGDPAVIKHIQEGVDINGKAAMQDAIRNQEMIEIAKAHKGAERDAVKANIQEIEPEINAALNGEVPEAPLYDEYIRKESGRGANLDYEIRYAKELRDQANKNSEWIDRNIKSFFPAEMKWNMAGNARLKELADNQEKYVKQLTHRATPVPKPDVTKDRGALIPKSIGTPENINTIALSDILLKSLQEGEQLNKIRILGITAKALNVPVSDLKNHKSIDEAMEYAIVKRAREILQVDGADHYLEMKNLYNQQPNLTVRTSTSITNQAYSTPVPLAYLMDKYLNITPQDKVYEPTAGNGMLVIGANPENTWVNEIDKKRSEHLNDAGYRMVTNNDASKEYKQGHKTVDVSVMNPPFGIAEQKTYDGFKISKLEHQIAIEALNAMKDSGRAAIIIGGHNFKNGNMVESDRIFLNYLYSHYNVTHNIDIDGDIYRKMGASYPIRLITVEGRKTTPDTQYAPNKEQIESAMNFDRVKEILEKPVEKGIVKAETGAIHDNIQSAKGSVGEESKGVAGKGEAAGVKGVVTTERKPIREEQRPAARRGSRTDVGTERAGIDGGVPEAAIRPVHKEGIRPLDVTVGISQQQSGVKASGVSDLSESDFDSLINEVRSEGQEPTISEKAEPYGEGFDIKRYEKVKPFFAQVLDEFTRQDKTVKEFIKHVLDKYNESIVPYLKAFHRDISTKAVKQEIPSNEFQVQYKPQSKAEAGDNLIPKNMEEAVRKALKKLSDKVGGVDNYVKNKLGYTSDKDFQSAFAAEQIDGLAMAINAIDSGEAIIVGDQTGVGKGRQAAGIIRYANKLGKKPIFFTANPKLFSDIYRDLVDIGYPIVPFIMHTDATKASVYDEDGNKIFKPSGNPAIYKQMVNDVDAVMSKYKAIILPYSQIRTKNIQQQIINQLAKGNIIILDESHMASGESETGNFVRHILKEAKGALYLSATYAKRPDTMPLYYRTKLGASKMSINDLVSAVNNGGVLLQQYIANGLSGMGQMIRRELNYSGVKFEVEVDTDNFEQDSRKADDITDILRQIVAWDGKKQLLIDVMDKQIKTAGGRMTSKQQTSASVTSSNFAATVHNNISQLLLGLKADATVNRAIQALKEGKKPFIGVMNTMESFLEHMVKEQGASVGEPIGFTFRDVLKKSLTGTLRYAVTDAMGNKSYDVLKVDEMPSEFQSAYRSIESDIDTLDTSVPASPIDYIKNKISEAGYKVDEITGRAYYIDYSKKIPVLAKRSQREINDRNAPVNNFNSGKTDALIVNAAGSTGLSIHSSSKFKDQRQRKGIIAQADLNIDTFMQLLGRINRKGQVNLPEYTILQTALPAEIRPAIVLSKKMSSLNANISANKNSATTMKNIPEMMNHYGDKIVIDYLMDNSNVNDMLGDPLDLRGKVGKDIPEDAFKKASGRMALLPVEVQKDFYAQIESDYVNLIDYLNQIGENNLEAKDYNFEAKPLEKTQIYKGTDESNPFTSDTYLEKVSVKVLKQPYNTAKIKELIGDKTSDQHHQSMVVGLKRDAEAYKETLKKKQTLLGRIFGKGTTGVDDDMDYVASRLSRFRIGNTYDVAVTGDYVIPGVLIDVKRHKGDGSPVAPSKISLVFAVSDSTQIITMPLSKKLELSATHQTSEGIARNWDSLSATSNRETRYIVTGNLVQGFDRLSQKAEIVNYTTDTGERKQGILIPKSIKDAEVRLASTSVSHEDVYNILSNNRDIDIVTTNSEASVNMDRDGDLTVVVPKSKLSGAKYFLNDKIRDLVNNREFQSVGSKMRAFVPASNAREFLKVFEEETNIRFAIPKRLMGGKDDFTIAEQSARYGSPLTVNEITAYHGSPYRFDKFSSEKIGTGEGAQAFGHGLYFTDEKEVAEWYAKSNMRYKVNGKDININELNQWVKRAFSEYIRTRNQKDSYIYKHSKDNLVDEVNQAIKYKKDLIAAKKMKPEQIDDYMNLLKGIVNDDILPNKSNTYSVTLHKGKSPEQYEYIPWNARINLNAWSKIEVQSKKEGLANGQIKELYYEGVSPAYSGYDRGGGERLYHKLSEYLGSDKSASDFLLRAGIDGIKYPSGSLSGKESDKFNYVVFDPEAVTIETVGEKQTSYNRRPDYDQQTYNKAKARLDKISSESGGVGDRGRGDSGIITLGVAIRRDLLQKGRVDLRGQTVKLSEDIAVISQVFRSPQFETFRIGYVKDGVIVGMDGVSSRMPGVSSVFLQGDKNKHLFNILDRAKRLGADSFYFLHNHPSGKPAPSQEDMETTASIVGRLKKMADKYKMNVPKFISHVVINSGKYAVIDYDVTKPNELVVEEFKLPSTGEDILLTAEKTNEYLTSKITMPDDIVKIGQALKQPENFVTVIYRGSDSMVRAIEAMPINQFLSKDVAGILRNRARAYGARHTFSYYDGQQKTEYTSKSGALKKTGVLLDSLYGKWMVGELNPPQVNQWMGLTTDKTTVRVAEEIEKYSKQGLSPKQIIDKIFRLPFSKHLDADGRWHFGVSLYNKLSDTITSKTTGNEVIDGFIDIVRKGVIDKYALPENYKQYRKLRELERNAISAEGLEYFHEIYKATQDDEQKKIMYRILTEDVSPEEWEKLSEPVRNAIVKHGQEMVDTQLLSQETFENNKGKYLHRIYEKHRNETPAIVRAFKKLRLVGKELKHRGTRKYVSPKEVEKWISGSKDGNTWKQIGNVDRSFYAGRTLVHKGSSIIWRDWTKEERTKMGEVEDAALGVATTFDLMAKDLSTGKLYKRIAEDGLLSSDEQVEGWTHFGNEKIPNSNTNKWGMLANKWVHPDVAKDLLLTQKYSQPSFWRWIMTQWKLNKTVRNPVVHFNNIMSNVFLADMHDLGMSDVVSAIRDYKDQDQDFKDAQSAGVFGHNIISAEIKKYYNPAIEDAAKSGNLAGWGWEMVKRGDRFMAHLYSVEDDIFRLALFKKLRRNGKTVDEASQEAIRQFIDYDVSAPWIQFARNYFLPFITYPYKALPLVTEAALTRPWKLLKYYALFAGIQALSEALIGVDSDEERKLLQDYYKGRTWVGIEKMVRIPWGYLDISRLMPGADIFSLVGNKRSSPAIPIPSSINLGGPLDIGVSLLRNQDPFTGKKIKQEETPVSRQALDVSLWIWRQLGPNAPWVPKSYSWDKIVNAFAGVTDELGRPQDVLTAALSTFGVKVSKFDPEIQRLRIVKDKESDISGANKVMLQARWRFNKGEISKSKYEKIESEQKEIIERHRNKISEANATARQLMQTHKY